MKFVKANLTLVICGAVALLAIIAVLPIPYLPITMLDASLQGKVQEVYAQASLVKQMESNSLEVPGTTEPFKGPPEPEITAFKRQAIDQMKSQAQTVATLAAEANRKNYVTVEGQGPTMRVIPKLNGEKYENFLPKHSPQADPMQFRQAYGDIFDVWMAQLISGTKPPAKPGTPPTSDEISKAYNQRPAGPGGAAPGAAGGAGTVPDEFTRKEISDRASEIHMYVDPGAFQRRDWLSGQDAPDEPKMFDALVDCWFQGDVVNAITAINDETFTGANLSPEQRNVGRAAVKRLEAIVVGNKAAGLHLPAPGGSGSGASPSVAPGAAQSGDLFFTGSTAAPAPGAANTIDVTRSLTGRASGADYDVVLMAVVVDLDLGQVNHFIDKLYKQNIGYTVLNVETRAVDPLEAASNGYLYGQVQVYQVKILVEGMLFRNWTQPLMPDSYRTLLGIVTPAK